MAESTDLQLRMRQHDYSHADNDEEARFISLLSAKWVAQALSTAAELGVFDALEPAPRSCEELATSLNCQARPLSSLLRVLSGEGLLHQDPGGEYSLTSLGQRFTSSAHGVLARFIGSASQWHPWAHLPRAIRTGRCAFELAHGSTLFSYLKEHPQEAALYHEAVDAFTHAQARALSELELFENVQEVVDVGGGRGTLLIELLRRHSRLRGTLFDLPEVVEESRKRLSLGPLGSRLRMVSGDFFHEMVAGHDCYIIKHVLHNWSDEDAALVLRKVWEAATLDCTIIVVDDPLLPGNHRDLSRFMDLEMFVVTGAGRERSKPELRQLFARAGLGLIGTKRLTMSTWAYLLKKKPSAR